MSNYLAIATVTATLRQTLGSAVATAVPGATVTTMRPDAPHDGTTPARVNLYLYQVTADPAYRSDDLPTRGADGHLMQRPRVALDLHYLFTFYGDEAHLEPQRMLGNVLRVLHTQPVLTPEAIQKTITAPTFAPFLAKSDLGAAIEHVRFTRTELGLEEFSKLWSVFLQTPYSLSVAYQSHWC
jgi:hypothetical protein